MDKPFSMIAAVALNGVIGDSQTNSIPWYIPDDLKHFKEITTGKVVVMGSRTFNSLPFKLPNRENVVITRGATDLSYAADRMHYSFANAYNWEQPGFMVIGGAHIYGEALKYGPERLYITVVKFNPDGDVHFPIEGRRMLQDHFETQSGLKYVEESRSAPMFAPGGPREDLEYEFVVFKRA